MTSLVITGDVQSGFEPVRALFERTMQDQAEQHAQLCVYVGEDRVVDLCATHDPAAGFTADSIVNIFSSGKSLEAIAMASLVSKGLLDYEKLISDYWPEYGKHGKENTTVADLMRHEAGLSAFDVSIDPNDLLTQNIKQNKVGKIIEEHSPKFREGDDAKREYHAVTRGWIINEVFRRVDPDGRTIGEYLREELSGPLDADIYIGVPDQKLGDIHPVEPSPVGKHLLETMKPRMMGRRVTDNVFGLSRKVMHMAPSFRKGSRRGAPPPFKDLDTITAFNEKIVAQGETPSANTHSSARGLAKLAAVMANGGVWENAEYFSTAAWQAAHDQPVRSNMGMQTNFTQGGVALFDGATSNIIERALNQGREGFYGWMGLGGSIFQWHPEARVGFAFVPTQLHVLDFVNERGKVYQKEIMKCLRT